MTTKYFWTCAAQDRSATFHNTSMIIPCRQLQCIACQVARIAVYELWKRVSI